MTPRVAKPAVGRAEASLRKGRLKVHDPFELIRWLALSQTDPRKALAELVQNSPGAGARSIEVTRERIKGVPCLRVRDNGEGVIPELDRPEALRYIATHISGHPEFREIADRPGLKLRYLALLFAKEIVLRSTQDPRLELPLEQLVEVAAYADRKLGERRPGRRRKGSGTFPA